VIYALTGVPGAGKSSVADELERRGHRIVRFESLIGDAIVGREDESSVVDMDRICETSRIEDGTIVVGHLAHELNVDAVIVLRARPEIIEQRLRARGYSEGKAVENAEAEAIDVITIESVDSGRRVYEIDASELSVSEAADRVEEIIGGRGERFAAGRIDFSSYILGGY